MTDITIDDIEPRRSYEVGNTPQDEFTFPFVFWADADLLVYVDDELLTLGDDYTVTGAGSQDGGTVTLTEAVSNANVVIVRDMAIERTTDFPNSGAGFKVSALNTELDRIVAMLQQVNARVARLVQLADSDPATASMILPVLSERAGRLLAFDSDGAPTASTVTTTQVDAVIQAGLADGRVLVELPPFTGDGATTSFDTGIPLDVAVMVDPIVGGVPQRDGAYEVSGSSVVFSEAPPNGASVVIRLVAAVEALSAVTSVAGRTGAIVLAIADVTGLQAALAAKANDATTTAALALKAPLASPTFTGTPAAPTASPGANTTQIATTAFVRGEVASLVASAPSTLDTLNELATALGNDPNFATTVTNSLAAKQPLDATLTALAALDSTAGLLRQTGADTFDRISLGYGLSVVSGALVLEQWLTVAISDESTAITTGTAKVTFRAPFAMTLTQIPRASLSTVSSSGNPTFDINENGTSILGANKLSIDSGEKTSTTAATATTLADTSIADDAEITIDVDTAGTGAKGAKVTLYFRRAS